MISLIFLSIFNSITLNNLQFLIFNLQSFLKINQKIPMTSDQSNSNIKHKSLIERTAKMGEGIIVFCQSIPQNIITSHLISQLVRSGTSIGANYSEANEASSKKDFINKISIANKEAKETKHWIRMMIKAVPNCKNRATELWQEAQELNLIFSAIIRSAKAKSS